MMAWLAFCCFIVAIVFAFASGYAVGMVSSLPTQRYEVRVKQSREGGEPLQHFVSAQLHDCRNNRVVTYRRVRTAAFISAVASANPSSQPATRVSPSAPGRRFKGS